MRRVAGFVFALALGLPSVSLAQNLRAIDVVAPTDLVAGRTAAFEITVAADMGMAPGSFSGELLLVEGGRVSTAIPLATFGPETIAAGQQRVIMADRIVPMALDGVYQVAVRLDPANAITETNELDNVAVSAMTSRVRPPAPDGVAVDVSAAATEIAPGAMLDVDVTVRNAGEIAGSLVVSIHLSRNRRISPSDPEIGRMTLNLGAGAQTIETIETTIPADLAAGRYQIGIVVDPEALVREASEANNLYMGTDALTVFWDSLTFQTQTLAAGTLTITYHALFESSGGDGSYVYSVTNGMLPGGLSIVDDELVGIPTRTGRFDFDVTCESRASSDTKSFSIEIFTTGAPVRIVTLDATPGFKDLQYEQILVAGGGEGPYSWEQSSGLLPPGLDLTTAGVISGIPQQIGEFGFEVTVVDSRGERDLVELMIEIVFASQVLVVSTGLDSIPLGVAAMVPVSAVGGIPPYKWTALTRPPPGMTLSEDGNLVGAPTRVGVYKMRVRASDATSEPSEDTGLIEIEIEDDGTFEITTKELPIAYIRARYDVVFEAANGTAPLVWRLAPGSELPSGFFIEPGDGEAAPEGTLRMFGVGFREADQPFIIRVEDDSGRRRELVYVLSVRRGDPNASGSGEGCVCVHRSDTRGLWLLLFGVLFIRRGTRRSGIPR